MSIQYPKKYALGLADTHNFPKVQYEKIVEIIDALNEILAGTAAITEIDLGDGGVSNPSITFTADTDTGIYRGSSGNVGFTSNGTNVAGFSSAGIYVDNIVESTTNNGVNIDSVLLKDGGASNSAGTILADFRPILAQDDITAGTGGAIAITTYLTTINTGAGGDAFTLANATVKGQIKKILLVVDGGGDAVITPTSLSGGTTITMNDAADYVILKWTGSAWIAVENSGCTIA